MKKREYTEEDVTKWNRSLVMLLIMILGVTMVNWLLTIMNIIKNGHH